MRAMDQMSNAMMNDAFSMLTGFGHRSMHPMLGFGGDQNMQRNRMIENDMMMSPFGGLGGPFGGGLLGPSLFGGMMGRMVLYMLIFYFYCLLMEDCRSSPSPPT